MDWDTYIPSEEEEQITLFSWAEAMAAQVPELRLLFHIPNGGLRTKREAAAFKAQGVKAGVPDLFLPVARKGYHGLFVELKRRKGGRLRPDQRGWLDDLFEQRYLAVCCHGADEAMAVIGQYLGITEGGTDADAA